MAGLLRDGPCPDEPMREEIPPGPCALPNDTSAGMPAEEPASLEPRPQRRISVCGNFSGIADDLGHMKPTPLAEPPKEPNPSPHFFGDMP